MRKGKRLEIRLERLQYEYLKIWSHMGKKPIAEIIRELIQREMILCKVTLPKRKVTYNEWRDK